jgi:uncharacterized protein YabE (DUF348 family)/3D (Asp-Asp-Asp) domain-containing protein
MGVNLRQDAHVQRSSSMSFAMRWKHENKRIIVIAALVSIAMLVMFFVLLQGTNVKFVTVVLNGQESMLQTKQSKLQSFLDEQAISVGEYDRISMPLNGALRNGAAVTIDHAIPVQLTADGETKMLYTTAKTVKEAFEDLQISLGDEDRVLPALNTEITKNSKVEIVRVKTIVEEQEDIVPYGVVTQKDTTLIKGKEKVIQEGKAGIIMTKVQKVFENGTMISEQVIDEEVRSQSFDRIVAVGTKNPVVILSAASPDVQKVNIDGMAFGVKQVLENVTLTAYDAGVNSTGKSSDHPQFGITYSGATVKEGHTIAVDPKVIPLGWWVYIEGIGLRKAEDIGSAIKGKKIDVYMESEADANRFGRKYGYTVYVVGPTKPVMN